MARKDLEGVLRNLYCFLEILQKSRSDEVSNWDKQSMSHALKWAAFADQVFAQSENKLYRDQLDAEVQKLGRLHWHLGDYVVKLASLQHSREKLISNLLQNANLKSELKTSLLNDLEHISYGSLSELCSRMTSTQALSEVLMSSQLTSSHDDASSVSDVKKDEVAYESEARVLCHSLMQSLGRASRAHVIEKLQMFASCKDGINVIASALAIASSSSSLQHGISTLSNVSSSAVCDVLLQFFLKLVETSEDLFWSVSPVLMARICCQSSDLFDRYLRYLFRCGDCLHPDYGNFVTCGRRLTHAWRLDSSDRRALSYDGLRQRLLQLLFNTNCHRLASVTLSELQTLADLSDREPNLWKNLLTDLRIAVANN